MLVRSEERNYPAVDLGNSEKRICVQVTSTPAVWAGVVFFGGGLATGLRRAIL